MSPEPWLDRVRHMVADIDLIRSFMAGMSREAFLSDAKTMYAVTNAFMRIGEAARRIPDEVRDAHPKIEWRDIRHFRNFVVHVYDKIDGTHLWEAAVNDLPPLREKLAEVLRGADEDATNPE